jgi:hypothetical protein
MEEHTVESNTTKSIDTNRNSREATDCFNTLKHRIINQEINYLN